MDGSDNTIICLYSVINFHNFPFPYPLLLSYKTKQKSTHFVISSLTFLLVGSPEIRVIRYPRWRGALGSCSPSSSMVFRMRYQSIDDHALACVLLVGLGLEKTLNLWPVSPCGPRGRLRKLVILGEVRAVWLVAYRVMKPFFSSVCMWS